MGLCKDIELLKGGRSSEIIYNLKGGRLKPVGILPQGQIIADKPIIIVKFFIGGLESVNQRQHIRIFYHFLPFDGCFGKGFEILVGRRADKRFHC